MDYRYTEDFARQMEAAEWRAHDLRKEALASMWQRLVATGAGVLRRLRQRLARGQSSILPEA